MPNEQVALPGPATLREPDADAVTLPRRARPRLGGASTMGSARTMQAPASDADSTPPLVTTESAPLDERGFDERYAKRSVLGEGGMGEVRLCRDQRIGRDVAMKVIRPGAGSHSDLRARFEREARVQGQLDHPAIVPVYDLGVGPDGAAYFTMKRLRGLTFEEVLAAKAEGEEQVVAEYSTRKLLGAFAQVCLALAFAHSRGVLHRDLKPANVMLGDFGEVYVLDWGLAKLVDQDDPPPSQTEGAAAPSIDRGAPIGATAVGTIMGTPGYMSPEQVRGDELDPRSDVYALGAILFEILALTPLHDRDKPTEAILVGTLTGADARPSSRVPELTIAPELEAICVRACALEPDDRYESARALHDDLERFLDGDRDLARRQALAASHATSARGSLDRAIEGGDGAIEARASAMREVGRALAFDPANDDALSTMLRLLVEPPEEIPKEAEEEFSSAVKEGRLAHERAGSWAYLSWFVVAPLFCLLGVRNVPMLAVLGASIVASFVLARLIGTRRIDDLRGGVALFVVSSLAVVLSGFLFGPFVLMPGILATNTLYFAMGLERSRLRRWIVAGGAISFLIPVALQYFHVTSSSYVFGNDSISIVPFMTHLPPKASFLFLVLANFALVVVPSVLVSRVRDETLDSERRMFLHLWHLRQLIPDRARHAADLPDARRVASRADWGCVRDEFIAHFRRASMRRR